MPAENTRDVDSDIVPLPTLVQRRKLKVRQVQELKCIGVSWLPDSKHIVAIDQTGAAVLWDTVNSNAKQFLIRPHAISIAVSPTSDVDHTMAAIGGMDNTITVCNLSTGLDQGEVTTRLPAMGDTHDGLISALRYIDENTLASVGGDGDLRVWDCQSAESTSVFKGHKRDATCISISGKGASAKLASGSMDGTVRVWDQRAGVASHVFECANPSSHGMIQEKDVASLPEVGAVSFFPSGDIIACGASDGSVRTFDLRSSKLVETLHAPSKAAARCSGIAWSNSGRALYTANVDGTLGIWEAFGKNAGYVHSVKMDSVGKQPMSGLAMSPDGSSIAVPCHDQSVRVFTPKVVKA